MKRTTITLSDELESAVEEFLQDQTVPPSLTALAQAAIHDFLALRGYLPARRPPRFTPAETGDGDPLGSVEHDRLFVESWE
jgi:hypothetical protein